MKTLSITEARQNLGSWLKRSLIGEDIGVLVNGAVIAFRPVKIISEDYAEREYNVTSDKLDRFSKKVNRELDRERKAGRMKPFTGKLTRD
jgi:antitoxin (DNA-binding transcriptional repressor) of toxin-antitoxin stability system